MGLLEWIFGSEDDGYDPDDHTTHPDYHKTNREINRFNQALNTSGLRKNCRLEFEIVESQGNESFLRCVTVFSDTEIGSYFFRDSLRRGTLRQGGWNRNLKICPK